MWDLSNGLQQKAAPGKKPNQGQTPEKPQRNRSVIVRDALIQIAEKVFIYKVEPEEPTHAALSRIPQSGQNVPWNCNRQEDQRTRNQSHSEQPLEVVCQKREHQNNTNGKDNPNESF